MYCKFIKLSNGEDIIAMTGDDCSELDNKKYIEVSQPVAIHTVRVPHSLGMIESFVMRPWAKMVKDEVMRIPVHSIVMAGNVMNLAEEQYLEFVTGNTNELQDASTDELHAYHESPSRDDVLNRFFEALESDEEDDDDSDADSRIIH